MNTQKIAAAIAGATAVLGLATLPATTANAAAPSLGGKVVTKNVVTEQHCYRTVVTTYQLFAGKYWEPVHKTTTYHVSQCQWGFLNHRRF